METIGKNEDLANANTLKLLKILLAKKLCTKDEYDSAVEALDDDMSDDGEIMIKEEEFKNILSKVVSEKIGGFYLAYDDSITYESADDAGATGYSASPVHATQAILSFIKPEIRQYNFGGKEMKEISFPGNGHVFIATKMRKDNFDAMLQKLPIEIIQETIETSGAESKSQDLTILSVKEK